MTRPTTLVLLLAYLGFISLGLPDTVLGVAWPTVRAGFGLPQSALGLLLGAGMLGYFSSGLLAGVLMARLGAGGLLAASGALGALAASGYAWAPAWPWWLPTAFCMGFGSGAIDAGLNGYAARHFSVRHVNWLHACWGIGASTGPVIMTAAIARGGSYRVGYASLAVVLGALAGAFLLTRRHWSDATPPAGRGAEPGAAAEAAASSEAAGAGWVPTLRSGRVWLLMATFFLYTGLESTLGQWSFTLLREGRGLGLEAAGSWTAAYWASLTIGRAALGFVVEQLGADRLLRLASRGLVAGALAFALDEGWLGRLGLLLMGSCLAPVFPTLMARTPARLGALAHHAVGFQVSAATLGSTLLPAAVGVWITSVGLSAIGMAAVGFGVAFLVVHECVLHQTRPEPTAGVTLDA